MPAQSLEGRVVGFHMRSSNSGSVQSNVPVALVVFNRPGTTARVLEAISRARPRQLLVIADGPRPENARDRELCAEVRRVVQAGVNWPCEFLTNYAETNLGCRQIFASGMAWVFSIVSEALVLEDDCVAHSDFFVFARAMLDRYREDARIMHINGTNLQGRAPSVKTSHFFSAYNLPWGWATWRRAWSHYNVDMTRFAEFVQKGGIGARFRHSRQRLYFENQYKVHCDPATASWDWQWIFTAWARDGLAVTPSVNLVSNIGDGSDALHSTNHPYCGLPVFDWTDSKEPPPRKTNEAYDRYVFERYFSGGAVHGCTGMVNAWMDALQAWRIKLAFRSRFMARTGRSENPSR
jgi:hypothetical protein